MDSSGLAQNIDLVASAGGATLNLEHRASLPSALALLQNENNFARVTLWGRITGDKQDYIIAQGFAPAPDDKRERSKVAGGNPLIADYFESIRQMPKKSFRLGPDGVTFVPIPPVDPEVVRKNAEFTDALNKKGQVFAPFSGDPAAKNTYEFVLPAPPKAAKEPGADEEGGVEEEEAGPQTEEREISEEERLAYTIERIDEDTSVVPRGAFVLGSSSQVLQNSAFRGLAQHDARKLSSYMHFRTPSALKDLSSSDRGALTKSIDFLDPLALDKPHGCWASGFDGINNSATLRSLMWPGYTFYHVVNTNNFGSFYSGTGERNLDIAFML